MTSWRSETHPWGAQISDITPFSDFFTHLGCPMTVHLKLCGDTKRQRVPQAVQVCMHMGVNQAGHKCCAVTIDDSCPCWYLSTHRLYICPFDYHSRVVDDTVTVEDPRLSYGCNPIL